MKFSPFYPHGSIPVPFSEGVCAESVEGIWQGLKVFESEGIDPARFANRTMKGLKRAVRKYGRVRGRQKGTASSELLDSGTARQVIYLPACHYVLDHFLREELAALRAIAADQDLVLLDYETNADPHDLRKPPSHASIVIGKLDGPG